MLVYQRVVQHLEFTSWPLYASSVGGDDSTPGILEVPAPASVCGVPFSATGAKFFDPWGPGDPAVT